MQTAGSQDTWFLSCPLDNVLEGQDFPTLCGVRLFLKAQWVIYLYIAYLKVLVKEENVENSVKSPRFLLSPYLDAFIS